MEDQGFVDPKILRKVAVGRDYVAAKYGFRNHWYPALFSSELEEGKPQRVELLGEAVLLNRIDGQVFGMHDRCLHRGVALSRKVECYTKGTITCWYHGFTYRFSDGQLCDIVGVEKSAAIGRRALRTYPVVEAKGVIFVFIGDADFEVPPLAHDVPPRFLEDGLAIRGIRREVEANWRIGVENGFDSTHIFIHKDSILIEDNDLALPLGMAPLGRHALPTQEEPDGPIGVYELFGPDTVKPVFEGTVEGQTVLTASAQRSNMLPGSISAWLPGALCVDPWPDPSLVQFEWYVPIDGKRHIYFQMLGKRVADAEAEDAFDVEFEGRWKRVALEGFNDDDVWAREATEPFYADDRGWVREQLFEPDANIVKWRSVASKHRRGIQLPKHID